MKQELEILEQLAPDLNYLLNEGVVIDIKDKIRAEFLLNECLKYLDEMYTK